MRELNFTFDPDEKTMIFTVDTRRSIRVAYNEGQVWYAVCDIAKLLKYSAPGKAAKHKDYGVKLVRVPHTSINVKGYTNCNCITKDGLKRFLKLHKGDADIVRWILNEVIPQAERQFAATQTTERPARVHPAPELQQAAAVDTGTASLLDMLDQFIIAAVSLRREIQTKM